MEEHGSRQPKTKVPRRTIYFASGETMEEYSTDEEEEEEDLTKNQVATVDTVGEICPFLPCRYLKSSPVLGALIVSSIDSQFLL